MTIFATTKSSVFHLNRKYIMYHITARGRPSHSQVICTKVSKDWKCSFGDILADKHTDTHTYQTDMLIIIDLPITMFASRPGDRGRILIN